MTDNPLALLAISFVLSFLAESLVEYLFGEPINHYPKLAPYRWLLQYISAAAGVGLAFYYGIDLIALIATQAGSNVPVSPVGTLLTGLIIGRGANYLHQVVSTYLPKFK